MTTAETPKILEFRGEHRWLSNFWPAEIRATLLSRELIWSSSEHVYQASKLIYAESMERDDRLNTLELIHRATAGESKRMGQNISFSEEFIRAKRFLMEAILERKFFGNSHLLRELGSLSDYEIFEGNSWGDTYWGVDLQTGEGSNNLGEILMELSQRAKHFLNYSETELRREITRRRNRSLNLDSLANRLRV